MTAPVVATLAHAVALGAVLVGNGFLTLALVLAGPPRAPRALAAVDGDAPPDLAVVRPLHGPDASGGRNNAALLGQRYGGATGFVFVASQAHDPGLVAAREAHGADPRVSFLVSESRLDTTDKAAGMIAAWRATTAPFIAFCDADMCLGPDDLAACMALFDEPDVAGVFAPALHLPSTVTQRLLAMIASGDKLITVRALERVGCLRLMEGGLMVVRRAALEATGSIDVLRGTVADDLRLATVLAAAGFRLRAGPAILHAQAACGFAGLARQYHRWMRCQRVESPGLLGLQLALHAVVVPLIAWLLDPTSRRAALLVVASLVWRLGLTAVVERSQLRPHGLRLGGWILLRPVADLLHFAACAAAFAVPSVRWGGRTYRFDRRAAPRPRTKTPPRWAVARRRAAVGPAIPASEFERAPEVQP